MTYVKDFFVSLLIIVLILLGTASDDSYEDSKLSAQVLDEAIAQANEDQKENHHVLVAHQD